MLELKVIRNGVALGRAALRGDLEASSATQTVRQFDAFLARHDAPAAARIPQGFEIKLDAAWDNASGNAGAIILGGPNERLARSLAEAPAMVGHELAHGVQYRLSDATRHVSEGWVDVVGQAFAHSTGSVAPSDWRFAPGVMRDHAADAPLRDLANPELRSIDSLRQLFKDEGALEGYLRLGDHGIGALVSRPAAIASARAGSREIGRVYTHAFLHELVPRARAAYEPVAGQIATGSMIDSIQREVEIAADATLTTASRLYPRGSVAAELEQAWRAVGIGG